MHMHLCCPFSCFLLQTELDKSKFFAKPKLALDAVGGQSGVRLADCLVEGGQLVVYGCMSGKSPQWNWHSWVFQNIQVWHSIVCAQLHLAYLPSCRQSPESFCWYHDLLINDHFL